MEKNARLSTALVLLLVATMRCACAATIAVLPGEWETTSHIDTPQGPQVLREKVCRRGAGVGDLLARQQGEQCGPWQETPSGADGTLLLRSTCRQASPAPGSSLTLHVQARVTVATDGRSAHGTVQASGTVNGMTFNTPSTRFTSRFLGACPGH